MASAILEHVKNLRVSRLLAFLSFLLATGLSSSEAGYLYQTRHTQQSLGMPRAGHAAVKLGDGRVGIFAGGALSDVQLFDPATEQFTVSRAKQWFANFAGAPLPNGNALLVDGQQDRVFDYVTEQYIPTENAYTGGLASFAAVVPLPDGRILLCGGYDDDYRPVSACRVFDPRALRFDSTGDLVVPRAHHSAVLVDDHQVLIVGGYGYREGGSEQVALDSLEVFDINAGRSGRIRTVLQQPRYSHCSVRLPDGRVLIAGGIYSGVEYWLHSVEIFDPKMSAIVEGPSLGLGRNGAQTALLPSGRIAIFGGNYDARTIEVYCPETGTFELAQSLMLDPRWTDFTATSLDSGAVLLVGGRINVNSEGSTVENAEIFEEITTDDASAPAMTLAAIRPLLLDQDPDVVNETTQWLVSLGPQVKPTLETLAQDESSEVRRLAGNVLASIEGRDYPEAWCVEVWDASGVLNTIWLNSFEASETYNPAFPDPLFTAVLRGTEGTDLTHLVVRFPAHATYEARVRLFNLVGWTRIPKVVLGDVLSEDDLTRVVDPGVK